MPINNKYVGENIARLRVSFRMTQQQLAAALGVSHQAVSKWETGAALPDIESLLNISRLFGVTMEQLLKQPAEPEQAAEDAKDEPLFDPDVVEGLKEAAKRTAQTASEIGNAIFSRMGGALSNAFDACKSALGGDEDDEEEDAEEDDAEEDDGAEESAFAPEAKDGADESPMSLEALVDLAPFMSREKISAMVEAYQGPIDRKTLLHLAPFLTQETLGEKLRQVSPLTAEQLSSFAPFLKKEHLFRLVMENADTLDMASLKKLAPFLKRGMVDTLVDAVNGVRRAASSPAVNDFADKAKAGAESLFGKLRDAAVNFAQTMEAQHAEPKQAEDAAPEEPEADEVTPANEESRGEERPADADEAQTPEEGPAPSDVQPEDKDALRDQIASAALEARNWLWLKQNLSSIRDQELLKSIALSASRELGQAEAADIVLNAAPYLDAEAHKGLLEKLCDEGLWARVSDLSPFADEEISDMVISKALDGGKEALDALRLYARTASRDCVKAVCKTAIARGDWALMNAVNDAI